MMHPSTNWISVVEAQRILNRTYCGTRYLIHKRSIPNKIITKGKRQIIVVCKDSITKLSLVLPARRKDKHSKRPRFDRKSGYVMVYSPRHYRAMSDGYVYQHWLVAEKMLGRRLKKKECVHHKNRIRHNNTPENLKIFSSRQEAMRNTAGKVLKEAWDSLNINT